MTSVPWHIKAPTTSFRVYSKDVIETCFRDTFGFSEFSFFRSIIAVAAANEKKFIEVPIHFRPRLAGRSKLKFNQIAQAIKDLMRVRARSRMISRRRSYDFFGHGIPSEQRNANSDGSYVATGILECLAASKKTAERIGRRYMDAVGMKILEVGGAWDRTQVS